MKKENEDKRIRNKHIDQLLGRIAPDSWVIIPRYLNSLLRAGVVTPTEYSVYTYLRNDCNQYGISVTSVENIINDIFPQNRKPSKSWVNKILKSLLNKKLIRFKDRKGVAGSFEVSFDDFLLPNGQYSSLDKVIVNKILPPLHTGSIILSSDVTAEVEADSPMFESEEKHTTKGETVLQADKTLARSNTDKKNYNYTKTVSVSYKNEGTVLVEGFVPKSADEYTSLEIANYVEDTHMDWYLSLIANRQFWALEKAFGELKEDEKTKVIENKGAYLNGIVKRMLMGRLREEVTKKI